MPTFRNDTNNTIIYNVPGDENIIIFDPHKNVQLIHWVPYQKLGLTLVSEVYPPVPNTVLISGDFNFSQDIERKFDIEPCRKYLLVINVASGAVWLYYGSGKNGKYISHDISEVIEWKYVPYLRITGSSENSRISIHATLEE